MNLSFLNNISIQIKVMGLVVCLLILMMGSSLNISRIGGELEEVSAIDLPIVNALTRVTEHQLEQAIYYERAIRLSGLSGEKNKSNFTNTLDHFKTLTHEVGLELIEAEKIAQSGIKMATHEETVKEMKYVISTINNLKKEHRDYENHALDLLQSIHLSDSQSIEKQVQSVEHEQDELNEHMEALLNEVERFTTHAMNTAMANEKAAINGMWLTVLVGGPLALLLSYIVIRQVSKGLNLAVSIANQLAAGDFTSNITVNGTDEVGRLFRAMKEMSENISNMIKNVTDSSITLAGASVQTSVATERTNVALTQQQAATEQLAAAMSEMVATVSEVAKAANDAAIAARTADNEASGGKDVVKSSIDAIKSLSEDVMSAAGVIQELAKHSQSIGSVLDVIREIAEQTNLLALNAAIEAARAGEQGRGFAVVADEVRTLAQRTQASTEEIQNMIEILQSQTSNAVNVISKGQEKAAGSVQQAAAAGESLSAILSSINAINDMNTQIASAAEEQHAVADEVSRNITDISSTIQGASQDANETMSASNSVAEQAAQLKQMMGRFRCA
ncbi:methyl-accepting chemotaxis protein [Pseudomonadota bacterium]